MTAVEVILRQMAKDPKQRALFLDYAYGKIPQALEVTGKDGKDLIPVETMKPSEIAERVAALLAATKKEDKIE